MLNSILFLQSQWTGIVRQTAANTPATTPAADVPSATSVSPAIPVTSQTIAPAKCIWTEHTSPDGYKYYYNSATCESRVRILSIRFLVFGLLTSV